MSEKRSAAGGALFRRWMEPCGLFLYVLEAARLFMFRFGAVVSRKPPEYVRVLQCTSLCVALGPSVPCQCNDAEKH